VSLIRVRRDHLGTTIPRLLDQPHVDIDYLVKR
jgi:hypothetical protein